MGRRLDLDLRAAAMVEEDVVDDVTDDVEDGLIDNLPEEVMVPRLTGGAVVATDVLGCEMSFGCEIMTSLTSVRSDLSLTSPRRGVTFIAGPLRCLE
jgi:hypothetical protein